MIDKTFLENVPSIDEGKMEKKFYARLFIPFTINGWYVMGADKVGNDYKLFVVEKWNTPLVLRIYTKTVLLSELVGKFNTLKVDNEWNVVYAFSIFSNIKGLNR